MSTVRPVDLDQLHADIGDLAVAYRETSNDVTRWASSQPIAEQITALETHLGPVLVQAGDLGRSLPAWAGAEHAELRRLRAQQDRVWSTAKTSDGLLAQLQRTGQYPTQHAGRGGWVSGGKPGSRPPTGLGHLDLLCEIETAVWAHHDELRDELDDWAGTPWTSAPGGRVEWDPRPWQQVLATLPGLVDRLADDPNVAVDPNATGRLRHHRLASALARDVRAWRAQCRVLLGYTVRTTTLDQTCPTCLQRGRLTVREDASSDVTCRARLPLPDIAADTTWIECGEVWTRRTWVSLLVQTESRSA